MGKVRHWLRKDCALRLGEWEFGAQGLPKIKSLLQAVLLKPSLKDFFVAKKEAGHPQEDQGFPLY